jgi:DNA-binding response OmpR family regulator
MITNGGEILFVSNDTPDDATRGRLQMRGFQITAVSGLDAAAQMIGETNFAAIIVDLGIGPEAINLLRSLRANEHSKAASVLAVGEWGTGAPTVALTAGADAYEPAPLNAERLLDSIERMLTKRGLAAGVSD